MIPSRFSRALAALALLFVAASASAQDVQQLLKDVWVATPTSPREVNFAASTLDPIAGSFGTIRAMAFEPPQLGNAGAARSLIFVDGTSLKRFVDGVTTELPGTGEAGLSQVNTVAVADDGTVLFSGFSRRKRVYELWAYKDGAVRLRATGTPQLTDAVYLSPEDVGAAGLSGGGGGFLAATAKAIMFFAEPTGGWMSSSSPTNPAPLRDAASLGFKGNTQLLSVDLVRGTSVLMLATSDRKLLTTSSSSPTLPAPFDPAIYKPAVCTVKTPLLLVRNVRGGTEGGTTVVSDSCGQVVPYDFTLTGTIAAGDVDPDTIPKKGQPLVKDLLAIAVGEGNSVTCPANMGVCQLTSGALTKIDSATPKELLVLEYVLCDPRVAGCIELPGSVLAGNVLNFNSLLPQQIQEALKDDPSTAANEAVSITVPPYMFGAGPNGRFGALIVQTGDAGDAAKASMELEIDDLLGFKLGAHSAQHSVLGPFVRGAPETTTLELLNEDIVAYAPDNYLVPTVANYPTLGGSGFQATPVTTGSVNPLIGALRGFSVVMYGLQHDLTSSTKRSRDAQLGGLPSASAVVGSTPLCELHLGSQHFVPVDDPERFYINLAACLFADQERLLNPSAAPDLLQGAFQFSADRGDLVARLGNVKDKLIKALTASGPNTGSTDFQAVVTQVQNYRDKIVATPFNLDSNVYKNELLVRADAFKFLLMERAYPSLPIGGFPQP